MGADGYMTIVMLILIILLFVGLILITLIYFASQEVKGGGVITGWKENALAPHIDNLMHVRGWQTIKDHEKKKISVYRDSLTATNIIIKPVSNEKIELYYSTKLGIVGWLVMILLTIFMPILVVGIGPLLHINSRDFAQKEVIPMIMINSQFGPPPQFPQPAIGLKHQI